MSNICEEFQKELNSILESKPPISKAKMNSIVKSAIKSVKHYKHVVYFVENFIKNVCLKL
jgi:arginine/serine-rich splicing factor 15